MRAIDISNKNNIQEMQIGNTSGQNSYANPIVYQCDVEGDLNFSEFSSLKRVRFRNTKLTNLDWLTTLPKGLEYLDCNFNDFYSLELPTHSNGTINLGEADSTIKSFNFGSNCLTGDLPSFSNCTKLETIRMFAERVWQYSPNGWARRVAFTYGNTSYIPGFGTGNIYYKGLTGVHSNFALPSSISQMYLSSNSFSEADRTTITGAAVDLGTTNKLLKLRFTLANSSTVTGDLLTNKNTLTSRSWTVTL